MLDYPDSNRIKQNQNLLCYHYTIVQSNQRRRASCANVFAKLIFFPELSKFSYSFYRYLFSGKEEILLLALLYEEIFAVYQVSICYHSVKLCYLLLVEAYAAALCELAHLAL